MNQFTLRSFIAVLCFTALGSVHGQEKPKVVFQADLPYFSFADALPQADVVGDPDAAYLTGDQPNQVVWNAEDEGRHLVERGIFRFNMMLKRHFSPADLGIEVTEAEALRIRMKVANANEIELAWRLRGKDTYAPTHNVRIPIHDNEEWHTYVIKTLGLTAWGGMRLDVTQVDEFRLTGADTAGIEIEFLEIVKKRARFDAQASDVAYHRINNQLKQSIYTHTPLELVYSVDVPERAIMNFSSGIFENDKAMDFRVRLVDGQDEVLLHEGTVNSSRVWDDVRLDLSEYANKNVSIILETTSEETNLIGFWGDPHIYQKKRADDVTYDSDSGAAQNFNVLVYLVDTLRGDHLEPYNYSRETSPHLAQFAAEGVQFDRAYSSYSSTKASVASMFTSVSPIAHNCVTGHTPIPNSLDVLAEWFEEQGYATRSFIDNIFAGTATDLHRGFDHLTEMWHNRKLNSSTQAIEYLKENKEKNFFLYVHTMEPHTFKNRYTPNDEFDGLFSDPSDSPTHVNRYDESIRTADKNFGTLMKALDDLNLRDNTLVIFLADHGEAFEEHEWNFHSGYPYNHQVRIPFLVRLPGVFEGGRHVGQNISSMDLFPTLMDLFGQEPREQFGGKSILPLIQGTEPDSEPTRAVFSNGKSSHSIIVDDYKLIWRNELTGPKFLFNQSEDYEEQDNLVEKSSVAAKLAEMESLLKAYVDTELTLANTLIDDTFLADEEMSGEDIEELRALGYID